MNEKDMPKSYWDEVANYIDFYLMNKVHNIQSTWCNPPWEVLRKKARPIPCMDFGTIAYVHIPNEKQQKLDAKSEKCILVEYSLEQKG